MQQVVDTPFEQILDHGEQDKLQPQRTGSQRLNLFGRRDGGGGRQQQPAADEGDQDAGVVAVEEQPKKVLAELPAESTLLAPPREGQPKHPAGQGDRQQPEEVVSGVPGDVEHEFSVRSCCFRLRLYSRETEHDFDGGTGGRKEQRDQQKSAFTAGNVTRAGPARNDGTTRDGVRATLRSKPCRQWPTRKRRCHRLRCGGRVRGSCRRCPGGWRG